MYEVSLNKLLILFVLLGVPACTSPDGLDQADHRSALQHGDLDEVEDGAQLARKAVQAPGDDPDHTAPGLVHKTPKVPVVIDGVRYEPEDIHRFDGRPLYMIVDLAEPDVLTGFTKQRDFRAAADAKKGELDASITSQFAAGQYADYFSSDECTGDKLTVHSGWAINDLRAVQRGCVLWWCAGDWNDAISSVWINGSQTMNSDIHYGGDWFYIVGWGCLNASPYGFDNIASSLNVW